jgi:hypothetical protein
MYEQMRGKVAKQKRYNSQVRKKFSDLLTLILAENIFRFEKHITVVIYA